MKFHDGTDFNAQVVDFNVRRIWDKDFEFYYPRANSFTFYAFEPLEEITVDDDYTVTMRLKRPFAEFLRMQNQSYGEPLMISPEAVRTHGNEGFAQNPVGTGRFRLEERKEGESTTIVRFDDYWGPDKALLEKVIFRVIPDSQAAISALKAGETDMMLFVPPDNLPDLESSGFTISMNDGPYVEYWYLNFKNDVTAIKEIRQAMNFGLNRQGIVDDLANGSQRVANGIIPPGCNAYDPEFKGYDFDPEQAKALVAEAGFEDGVDVTFRVSEYGQFMDSVVARMQQDWSQTRDPAEPGKDGVGHLHACLGRGAPARARRFGARLGDERRLLDPAHRALQVPVTQRHELGLLQQPAGRRAVRPGRRRARMMPSGAIVLSAGAGDHHERRRRLYPDHLQSLAACALSRVQGFINPPEDWFQLWTVSLEE